MLGWFNAASVLASRWNLATRSGSDTNAAGRTLIATSTIELGVARAIDLTHSAATERRDHGVRTERQARPEARNRLDES